MAVTDCTSVLQKVSHANTMVWLHGSLGFLSLPAGEDVSPDSSPLSLFSHILPTAALKEEGVEAVKAALRDTMALERY